LYGEAANRRNEIAHGVVASYTLESVPIPSGFYVGPNFTTPKNRDVHLKGSYYYSSVEIIKYAERFDQFGHRILLLCEQLEAHVRSFPKKLKERF